MGVHRAFLLISSTTLKRKDLSKARLPKVPLPTFSLHFAAHGASSFSSSLSSTLHSLSIQPTWNFFTFTLPVMDLSINEKLQRLNLLLQGDEDLQHLDTHMNQSAARLPEDEVEETLVSAI